MKYIISILFTLFILFNCNAQKNLIHLIQYDQYENNVIIKNRNLNLYAASNEAFIKNSSTTETYFINYKSRNTTKFNEFNNIKYAVVTAFDSLPKFTTTQKYDTILGYPCKKIVYNIFSNTIEVFITETTDFKGSPSISFVPENALVLKYIVNGSRVVVAKSITTIDSAYTYSLKDTKVISEPQYVATQIKSRYTTLPVFNKSIINFENLSNDSTPLKIGEIRRFSKGNVLVKKIKLPKKNIGSYFIKLTEWSNGDAYDRVGSIFAVTTNKEKSILSALQKGLDKIPVYRTNFDQYQGIAATENYSPAVELMRFFTPFGVSHFNNKRIIDGYKWADSVVYKQDITALMPLQDSEIIIGAYIGNYDKGGHKISLEINFYPDAEMPNNKKLIMPLFNTVNVLEASGQNYGHLFLHDSLLVNFEIKDSIQDAQILFTTTGHGGWGGGDEFNPKLNQVFIDGKSIFSITPWRSDCATYRLENPASGNFPDGLSSSDLSRSNWCPGTLTPPFIIPLNNIKKGKHSICIKINQGPNEDQSFSHWCVSGVLIANKK